jgi:uncharacterized protein (TIGR03435 family)
MSWRIAVAWACLGVAFGQSFEVASVKPTPQQPYVPRQVRGGPGSTDPGAIAFTGMDLFSLITLAYGIDAYQLVGPAWLNSTRFDIVAKLPPGATTGQYRLMLQALLAERFGLAVHHDRKDGQAFDLVVAKNGPKLAASADGTAVTGDGSLQPAPSAPQPPAGYKGPLSVMLPKCTLDQLAARLSAFVGQPVTNATGLNGIYDIRIMYSLGLDADAPPVLPDALQQQLGLKLVPRKASLDLLVVDHVEKVPVAN